MKNKPELKQDADGTWYVEGNIGYVKGNVSGYVWGDVGWVKGSVKGTIHGDVGYVLGSVRDGVEDENEHLKAGLAHHFIYHRRTEKYVAVMSQSEMSLLMGWRDEEV